jgi:hypothetical protein
MGGQDEDEDEGERCWLHRPAANFVMLCWCRRKIKGSKQRGVMQEAAVFGKRAPYWEW